MFSYRVFLIFWDFVVLLALIILYWTKINWITGFVCSALGAWLGVYFFYWGITYLKLNFHTLSKWKLYLSFIGQYCCYFWAWCLPLLVLPHSEWWSVLLGFGLTWVIHEMVIFFSQTHYFKINVVKKNN